MKQVIFKFLLFSVLTIPCVLYAQTSSQEAQYKKGLRELNKFLSNNFFNGIKSKEIDTCLVAASFVKFYIDSLGDVKGICFSNGSTVPQPMKKILTRVIVSTSGNWTPQLVDGKPVSSKPYLLPIVLDLEAGCNLPNVDGTGKPYHPPANSLHSDLSSMLEFEDDTNPFQFEAILLKPLNIFSQR